MAYIGNQPTDNFVTFATQNFTTSATSSYTLSHAVSNENEIALFINNVRQHPGSGKAYTATGTALTLSANTASTDVMYCIFLGRAIQSTVPATNSITAAMVGNDLVSGKDALAANPAATDELLISDAGVLKRIDAQFFQSTPAFLAKPAVAATLSDDTLTKISFTEVLDTASGYDGSRFTPGVAGYYQVNVIVELHTGSSNGFGGRVIIYKNGSADDSLQVRIDGDQVYAQFRFGPSGVIYLDADDYIEVYASFNTASGNTAVGTEGQFSAYKIIGA